jgi:hypothetical protein
MMRCVRYAPSILYALINPARMPSRYHAARSPLGFSLDEMKRLSYELDHPSDALSHTANLLLRRDYLVEQRRRLHGAVIIAAPGASQEDETYRHTRLAKDIRSIDAGLKGVLDALRKLGVTTS